MHRLFASLPLSILLAVPAVAQTCIDTASIGTSTGVAGDETIGAAHIALGLTYPNPVGGAVVGGYTHVRVSTNGWAMLTDGAASTGLPSTGAYGSTNNTSTGLGGGAGSFPLLAPYWGDATIVGAGNAIHVEASTGPGIPAEITWFNTNDFGFTTVKKSVKALVYDNGNIEYQYTAGFNVQATFHRYVGVSTRNGIAVAPPQVNLSAGGSTGSGMCFQTFPTGTFTYPGDAMTFVPLGGGGWSVSRTCGLPPATTQSVGSGCYTFSETMVQQFNDAMSASAQLAGNSLSLIPTSTPTGYVGTWNAGGGASYFPPTSATGTVTSLAVSDDGNDTITPTVPFTAPSGSFATLTISHNGILTLGGTSNNSNDFSPTGAEVASSTGIAFYSWADYRDDNSTPSASGVIRHYEETVLGDRILYVTWDGVHRWGNPQLANQHTWQFQANLTTGRVDIVWVTMASDSTSTLAGGNAQVVGMTGPGSIANPGSQLLDRQYPLISEFGSANVLPLTLTVTPDPSLDVFGNSVAMTWTLTNVPEATQLGPMVRACNFVFSIGAGSTFFPGLDLGPAGLSIGAGGCRLHLGTLDTFVYVSTLNVTGICTLGPTSFMAVPPGLVVTTQASAIFPAGSGKGGVNNVGGGNALLLSNAQRQTYNPF